jgi:hypothetical protein
MAVTNSFSYIAAKRRIATKPSKLFLVAVIFTALAFTFSGCLGDDGGGTNITGSGDDGSSSSVAVTGDPMPDVPSFAGKWSANEPAVLSGIYGANVGSGGISVTFTDETGGSGKVTAVAFAEGYPNHIIYDNLPYTLESANAISISGMPYVNGTHTTEFAISNDTLIISRFWIVVAELATNPNNSDDVIFDFGEARLVKASAEKGGDHYVEPDPN